MNDDIVFVDYYDVLQVSPTADEDTIRRIFRHLAKKCHPDLPTGGNPELFRNLVKAHDVLSDPEKRTAYDVKHQEYWDRKWQILGRATNGSIPENNKQVRERILTVLYVQRRSNSQNPGLGEIELSRMLRTPIEFMEFDLWYLLRKGLVERLETGHMAISVEGVDYVEAHTLQVNEDHLLSSHITEA